MAKWHSVVINSANAGAIYELPLRDCPSIFFYFVTMNEVLLTPEFPVAGSNEYTVTS
jgi:hypothetical protein